MVAQYGADAMRMFEMFMGPLEEVKPWSTRNVEGVSRFLNRCWRLFVDEDGDLDPRLDPAAPPSDAVLPPEVEREFHATVKKVGEDIEGLAVQYRDQPDDDLRQHGHAARSRAPGRLLEPFVQLLAPFAPHLAEELWAEAGHIPTSIAYEPWPAYDEARLRSATVEIVVQVNGKVRARLVAPVDTAENKLETLARADEGVAEASGRENRGQSDRGQE